jgi:hypothetical protein
MLSPMTIARDLSVRLAELLRREHDAIADFLVALADFDRRRLHVEIGHASLFSFLHRELGLSKGAAFYRKTGAELVQRFPEIVEPLRDGRLCLTSLAELAKVITPENRAEVLPRFLHRSKREAAEVVAEIRPMEAPPLRAVVTVLRPAASAAELPAPPLLAPAVQDSASGGGSPENLPHANFPAAVRGSSPQPEPQPAVVEPLTADLRRYHLTVSKRFLAKLAAARDALSHAKPGAMPEEILEAGLDLLLAQDAKRKGVVARPRKTPPPSDHGPRPRARAARRVRAGRRTLPGPARLGRCLRLDVPRPARAPHAAGARRASDAGESPLRVRAAQPAPGRPRLREGIHGPLPAEARGGGVRSSPPR